MLNTTEVIFGMLGLTALLVGVIGYLGIKTLIKLRMPKTGDPDDSVPPTERS